MGSANVAGHFWVFKPGEQIGWAVSAWPSDPFVTVSLAWRDDRRQALGVGRWALGAEKLFCLSRGQNNC
jgi:hypothetical protein